MRVSRYYKLRRNQPTLDFVDVDLDRDLPFFIDPTILRVTDTPFTNECCAVLQDYFQSVLDAIVSKDNKKALRLLGELSEPNEVRLGLSKGRPRGRGIGADYAASIWGALQFSSAVRTGVIHDVEDTLLFIEGIGADRISDLVTNVIRRQLIGYTQGCCDLYGIPLVSAVLGPCWNPQRHEWEIQSERLPVPGNRPPILLVPRFIVRRFMSYEVDKYYSSEIIPFLRTQELQHNGELVQILQRKAPKGSKRPIPPRRVVYSDDIRAKYGDDKAAVLRLTEENPELLERYRERKRISLSPPLTLEELGAGVDLPKLFDRVHVLQTGEECAREFEDAIRDYLSALFGSQLSVPKREVRLHNNQKRIDLTFSNTATVGFFKFVSTHYPAANIMFECKNYAEDPSNPEVDQLLGRFSPTRGKLGFLVCRAISNRRKFVDRCIAASADQQGFVIGLDDLDLALLGAIAFDSGRTLVFLKARLDELVNRQYDSQVDEERKQIGRSLGK
jgi:hypothetical protein